MSGARVVPPSLPCVPVSQPWCAAPLRPEGRGEARGLARTWRLCPARALTLMERQAVVSALGLCSQRLPYVLTTFVLYGNFAARVFPKPASPALLSRSCHRASGPPEGKLQAAQAATEALSPTVLSSWRW